MGYGDHHLPVEDTFIIFISQIDGFKLARLCMEEDIADLSPESETSMCFVNSVGFFLRWVLTILLLRYNFLEVLFQ